MLTLPPVDWFLAGVLVVSVLIGVWRGLLFEVMSLAAWLLAWLAARHYGAEVSAALGIGPPESVKALVAGFVLAFVVTLIACGLLARLLRLLVAATPLSVIDRVLGALFGLVRGVLILLVLTSVLMWTPVAKSPLWAESRGAAWLQIVLQELQPFLPEGLGQHLKT